MAGRPARVILLNGVGSAGKTSLARAVQAMARAPFLHVQMDSFLGMLPARYDDHADTFSYRPTTVDGHPEVAITGGPLGDAVLRGMRAAVAAMANAGLDLIVDDVLMGKDDPGMDDYRARLSGIDFHTVGVFASLATLEQRERQRGDRLIGLARWQFARVHDGMSYDLALETDRQSPEQLARTVCDAFGIETDGD